MDVPQVIEVSVPVQQVEPAELKKLWGLITKYGVDYEAFRSYLTDLGLQSTKELSQTQLEQCLSEIDTRQGQAFQPGEPAAVSSVEPQGVRAQLFEALTTLQAELAQAKQAQPLGEPLA